jgi:hypothetical protein
MPIPGGDPEDLIDKPENPEPKTEDFLSSQMIEILKDAGVRIDTFRPAAPTLDQAAYAGHMEAGQMALADGRFFDAEERFTRAMSAMPGDPMAGCGPLSLRSEQPAAGHARAPGTLRREVQCHAGPG